MLYMCSQYVYAVCCLHSGSTDGLISALTSAVAGCCNIDVAVLCRAPWSSVNTDGPAALLQHSVPGTGTVWLLCCASCWQCNSAVEKCPSLSSFDVKCSQFVHIALTSLVEKEFKLKWSLCGSLSICWKEGGRLFAPPARPQCLGQLCSSRWPAGLALCTPSQPASLHRLSPPRTSSVSYSHLRCRSLPCIP